jgi:hypothetical protein
MLHDVTWQWPCTKWLTEAGCSLSILPTPMPPPVHHCPPYHLSRAVLNRQHLIKSSADGFTSDRNSLTLHAVLSNSVMTSQPVYSGMRHKELTVVQCRNCYESKCNCDREFWGSRRTAGVLCTAGTMERCCQCRHYTVCEHPVQLHKTFKQ